MDSLDNGAYTGDSKKNPYVGDLGTGIEYDQLEANLKVIDQTSSRPLITSPARIGAKKVVKNLFESKHFSKIKRILDIGSGTGISALEIFLQGGTHLNVDCVEMSEGMCEVAKYKFHQTVGLSGKVKDKNLLKYWKEFRQESAPYSSQARFINQDFMKLDLENSFYEYDAVTAVQVMHWFDLEKIFGKLRSNLKKETPVIWDSASHFYDDKEFPSAQYGFRYNDFMGFVLDEISKKFEVEDYKQLSRPKYNQEDIKNITNSQGFKTEKIGLWLQPVDFQDFVRDIVPAIVREAVIPKTEKQELNIVTQEAIAKSIQNPKALLDTTHKYDIVPIFKSRKLK